MTDNKQTMADLYRRLTAWSLPIPQIQAAYAELDCLTDEVARLLGLTRVEIEKCLTTDHNQRREQLIEMIEDRT